MHFVNWNKVYIQGQMFSQIVLMIKDMGNILKQISIDKY